MRAMMGLLLLVCVNASADILPRFPPGAVWYQDVSALPLKHPNSDNMIDHLDSLGGWGTGAGATNFQIDFSFYVLHADTGIATKPVIPIGNDADSYYYPDCGDFHTPLQAPKPIPIPLPAGGGIEGTGSTDPSDPFPPSYTCDNGNNDCHMLIVQGNTLFESGNTNVTGANVESMCALTWDLTKRYPRQGRGEQCTSTDAGGFPLSALLFNADEVWAAQQPGGTGDLGHAIRFILRNSRMMKAAYVHPANHGTSGTGEHGASDTSPDAVPYGSRLRLKGTYPVESFVAQTQADGGPAATASAKVILRTLQKYGMILSDGGTVPLSAEADHYTAHKWAAVGMDPDTQGGSHVVFGIKVTDFEVVNTGPTIPLTYDCVPTPADFIFIDGYEY